MVNGGQMWPGACSALGARPLWPGRPLPRQPDYQTAYLVPTWYLHYLSLLYQPCGIGGTGLGLRALPSGAANRHLAQASLLLLLFLLLLLLLPRPNPPLPMNGPVFDGSKQTIRGFVLRSHKLARPRRSPSGPPHTTVHA